MGKNPSFPFYPSDWTRDLDDLDIQIEGAWIRIICRLWWASPVKGQSTKTLLEWSRVLRTHPNKTGVILKTLLSKRVADGEYLDNQNITIICRRMVRDYEISELRKRVGKLGGNPALIKQDENLDNQKSNQTPNQKSLPSSSFSLNNKDILSSITEIVSYLNEKTGKNFSPKTKSTASHIKARFNEGRTVDDFKRVIDSKCAKWMTDPKMVDYLRPDTLFGTKFEAYLNELPAKAASW